MCAEPVGYFWLPPDIGNSGPQLPPSLAGDLSGWWIFSKNQLFGVTDFFLLFICHPVHWFLFLSLLSSFFCLIWVSLAPCLLVHLLGKTTEENVDNSSFKSPQHVPPKGTKSPLRSNGTSHVSGHYRCRHTLPHAAPSSENLSSSPTCNLESRLTPDSLKCLL